MKINALKEKFKNPTKWTGEMVQRVETLAGKPATLSSILGTHMAMRREATLPSCPLTSTCAQRTHKKERNMILKKKGLSVS